MTHRIEVQDFSISFGGVRAVQDFSAIFEPGTTYGLLGPNGSGKTTVLNMLSGHLRADSGTVRYADISGRSKAPTLARWGLRRTFQNLRLVPTMTVLENVALGADRRRSARHRSMGVGGKSERLTLHVARAALDSVGISHLGEAMPTALPYGTQRRVEIARAIAGEPSVLLLDEPTAGMGDAERDAIMDILERWKAPERTLIIVEHSLWMMQQTCDHLIALDAGRMIEQGAPDAVLASTAVRRAYLGGDA